MSSRMKMNMIMSALRMGGSAEGFSISPYSNLAFCFSWLRCNEGLNIGEGRVLKENHCLNNASITLFIGTVVSI